MAMLAEPRQRQKYILAPRGKPLYEDEMRFGTKMLKKMGWDKEKGLGAKGNGATEFVRARYKNNAKGLGFEDRNDQWTQHEEDFTGLLNSLNGCVADGDGKGAGTATADGAETDRVGFGYKAASREEKRKLKEKCSGESLEEKSKRSKARVHYKKFTRGKDLSQYSEKDLANIFGRRPEADKQDDGIYAQFTAFNATDDAAVEEENNNFACGPTIETGVSVNDYFKQKMEAMRNKLKKTSTEAAELPQNDGDVTEGAFPAEEVESPPVFEAPKKLKKSKKSKACAEQVVEEEEVTEVQEPTQPETSPKENAAGELQTTKTETKTKKKKNKKTKLITETPEQTEKNKKTKLNTETPEQTTAESIVHDITSQIKKSKKKSKKAAALQITLPPIEAPVHSDDDADSIAELIKCEINKGVIPNLAGASLADLQAHAALYNVHTISTFCAERFRNCALDTFVGSNLVQITGYSHDDKLQLNLKRIASDERRIKKLWDGTLDKYANKAPKYTYYTYTRQVRNARAAMVKKMPRLQVKAWKRRSAFQTPTKITT